MSGCRCGEVAELWGEAAKAYEDEHLRLIETSAGGWVTVFVCPDTAIAWTEDWPRSGEHGGGPRRLRRAEP